MNQLILASSSPSRFLLFKRLNEPFDVYTPDIDETPLESEHPIDLVRRLSIEKGRVIHQLYPEAWVVSGDQVAGFEDEILGKPGGHSQAVEYLRRFSGRQVTYYSGLCVHAPGRAFSYKMVPTVVHYRQLSEAMIDAYVNLENPYNNAGALKIEESGINLVTKLDSADPNALIGLPLMALRDLLLELDYPFKWAST